MQMVQVFACYEINNTIYLDKLNKWLVNIKLDIDKNVKIYYFGHRIEF